LDTFFDWLDKYKKIQIVFVMTAIFLPLFYFVDSSTNWNEVLVIHWYNNEEQFSPLGGIFFLGIYCLVGTIAYHAEKYCVTAFIPPAKYFIYATAIVAFLSMGSNTNSRTLANYLFFTSFIGGGFLIAMWGNKNENVDIIFTKTVSIMSKVFGWVFFALWLLLMGYFIYGVTN
jgi:hypothetical protein